MCPGRTAQGAQGARDAERTAEAGTYRIQSLAYQLEQAEKRAGIAHVEGLGLHGFRRMVAGDMYEILASADLAMEFINHVGHDENLRAASDASDHEIGGSGGCCAAAAEGGNGG